MKSWIGFLLTAVILFGILALLIVKDKGKTDTFEVINPGDGSPVSFKKVS